MQTFILYFFLQGLIVEVLEKVVRSEPFSIAFTWEVRQVSANLNFLAQRAPIAFVKTQ